MIMQQALKESLPPSQGELKMVDADLNVVSIATDDIPDWIKEQFLADTPNDSISQLTFFYHPNADVVVLNRDHKDADFYELLVTTYLDTTDAVRQKLKQQIPKEIVFTAFDLLDRIVAERRKKCHDQ